MSNLPYIIAVCGPPQAGKSTVADIISKHYGYDVCDDAKYVRDATKAYYQLLDWHVYTNEGKKSYVKVPTGEVWMVRDLMAHVGDFVEELHGDRFKPLLAIQQNSPNSKGIIFPSVRGDEGYVYKEYGGVVIEVVGSQNHIASTSDEYNKNAVDYTIVNNETIDKLQQKVVELFSAIQND